MKKRVKIINTLIKKKNLREFLKKGGIRRISDSALDEIEDMFAENLKDMSIALKEILMIKGKKTIVKEDIKELNKGKKEKYFEV